MPAASGPYCAGKAAKELAVLTLLGLLSILLAGIDATLGLFGWSLMTTRSTRRSRLT
jgi:hypothetical protein